MNKYDKMLQEESQEWSEAYDYENTEGYIEMQKILQEYCDRLNQYLPCKSQEDVDNISNILNEVFSTVKGSRLYWSREIFIDTDGDTAKCAWVLTHGEVYFVPINDIEEHIGVKVIYSYEKE